MKFFESKPVQQPKSIKRLNKIANYMEECRSQTDSQETCTSYSQESGSFGISSLYLTQESVTNKSENTINNNCNICFSKPKDGIFNHNKTAHVYCCYACSKRIWAKCGKCPICNLKVRYVTKAIII